MRIAFAGIASSLTLILAAETPRAREIDAADVRPNHPALAAFLSNGNAPPVRYRALRTLEATTRGGRMRATLKAWTSSSPEAGFTYSVVEESGSALIIKKVLRAALEAERTISDKGEGAQGALTTANYDFVFAGEAGDGLIRVDIHPKRTEKLLIDGSVLLAAADSDLVSVQGMLVKRPSFWTRRVEVVRRYTHLAGVRVPIVMRSTADVLLAGTSTFEMTYAYQTLNGVELVPAEQLEGARPAP